MNSVELTADEVAVLKSGLLSLSDSDEDSFGKLLCKVQDVAGPWVVSTKLPE